MPIVQLHIKWFSNYSNYFIF